MRTPGRVLFGAACVWSLVLCGPATSAVLPSGFTETLVAGGLTNATAMEFAPDGRLFVCLQAGQLRVIKDGVLLPAPFVSLTVNANGERGLLGIAFDPDFSSNQYVYLYYTATSPQVHNRVSRFTANGDVVCRAARCRSSISSNLSGATNHNGGAIHFGIDGKLYVAVGENANASNSQTLANRLGKILRINSERHNPVRQPVLRFGHRRQSRDLGDGLAQSVHVCGTAGDGPDLHQRRGTGRVGGDQRRRGRRQLRLARMRRAQRDQQQYSVLRWVRGAVPRL